MDPKQPFGNSNTTDIFGNKNRAKKPREPREPINYRKYWKPILISTIVFFALLIVLTNTYVVKENE